MDTKLVRKAAHNSENCQDSGRPISALAVEEEWVWTCVAG